MKNALRLFTILFFLICITSCNQLISNKNLENSELDFSFRVGETSEISDCILTITIFHERLEQSYSAPINSGDVVEHTFKKIPFGIEVNVYAKIEKNGKIFFDGKTSVLINKLKNNIFLSLDSKKATVNLTPANELSDIASSGGKFEIDIKGNLPLTTSVTSSNLKPTITVKDKFVDGEKIEFYPKAFNNDGELIYKGKKEIVDLKKGDNNIPVLLKHFGGYFLWVKDDYCGFTKKDLNGAGKQVHQQLRIEAVDFYDDGRGIALVYDGHGESSFSFVTSDGQIKDSGIIANDDSVHSTEGFACYGTGIIYIKSTLGNSDPDKFFYQDASGNKNLLQLKDIKSVTAMDIDGDNIYFITKGTDHYILRKGNINLAAQKIVIEKKETIPDFPTSGFCNDMQYLDGFLYVLWDRSRAPDYSKGALLKINPEDFTVCNVIGLTNKNMCESKEETNEYFVGSSRFIGREEKTLVIADQGKYKDNGIEKQISRVIKVDTDTCKIKEIIPVNDDVFTNP